MIDVADGRSAVVLDLPGFGASPLPDSVWGAEGYADAVAPVLDEMRKPVVVVGHSFGGRVALQLATKYPERVGALVLTGVPLIRRAPSRRTPTVFRLMKRANRLGLIGHERMERERQKRGSVDYRAATGIMRDVFVKLVNESYEEQLKGVTQRVEMVWGEADTEAPLAQAQEALSLLADGHLTIVSGGTHWLPTENPQPVRDALQRCLAQ